MCVPKHTAKRNFHMVAKRKYVLVLLIIVGSSMCVTKHTPAHMEVLEEDQRAHATYVQFSPDGSQARRRVLVLSFFPSKPKSCRAPSCIAFPDFRVRNYLLFGTFGFLDRVYRQTDFFNIINFAGITMLP